MTLFFSHQTLLESVIIIWFVIVRLCLLTNWGCVSTEELSWDLEMWGGGEEGRRRGNITIGMIVSCSALGPRHGPVKHQPCQPQTPQNQNLPHSSFLSIPIPITREQMHIRVRQRPAGVG